MVSIMELEEELFGNLDDDQETYYNREIKLIDLVIETANEIATQVNDHEPSEQIQWLVDHGISEEIIRDWVLDVH